MLFVTYSTVQMLHTAGASRSSSRGSASGPHGAGWDPAGETDALRRELDAAKKRLHAAEEDRARLQSTLSRKSQECHEVAASREALRKQADQQVQELEDALGDVQKRMVDSECKVKQLQAHVVAVKEHLGAQAAEELRGQLQEVKAKYEGASAEVGRVRNRLKQSEKALEEYKSSEGRLATEAERLGRELGALRGERDEVARALQETQAQLQDARARPGGVVPAEKFDNMKNLLTNAVDEKERQLAELREDYDRVLEEVAELHRAADSQSPQVAMPAEEHQRIRAALDEQNASLKRRLADVTAKSQELIREMEESEEEREILREQLDELSGRVEAEFVPLGEHEEAKLNMVKAMEELEDKIVEASERFGKAEAQVLQLDSDRESLRQNVSSLETSGEKHRSEMEAVVSQNAEMAGRLELLRQKCEEREGELAHLTEQSGSLEQRLDRDYVSRERHERANAELSAALEAAEARAAESEAKEKASGEELRNVKEGSDMLKGKLEEVLRELERDYVSLKEHEAVKVQLSAEASEAESNAKEVSEMYASSREETRKLNEELEAQKKELDTIHEAIASKFVPRTAVKEEENSYNAKVQDLTEKLLNMEETHKAEKSAGERLRRENENLNVEVGSLQERLEKACRMSKEAEGQFKGRLEEATLKSLNVAREYREEATIRAKLEEQNALNNAKIHGLETRLQAELVRIQGYEAEQQTLLGSVQQTQTEVKEAADARRHEAQRADSLQEELQRSQEEQAAALAQRDREREALEAEATELRGALREEQERAEDVAALRSELLRATHALEELRGGEEQAGRLKAENQRLEEEVGELGERLRGETERCDGLHRDTAQAREAEERARTEVRSTLERGQAVEGERRELKERYDESLSTIGDLQRRSQLSAEQIQVKEKKVFKLIQRYSPSSV